MKAVILAGGSGTRISEETGSRVPSRWSRSAGKPILWHIMKLYSAHGVHDFVICWATRATWSRSTSRNYFLAHDRRDVRPRVELGGGPPERRRAMARDPRRHRRRHDDRRPAQARRAASSATRRSASRTATASRTSTSAPARASTGPRACSRRSPRCSRRAASARSPSATATRSTASSEKPQGDGGWVNGGFFVLEPGVLDYIDGDDTVWERRAARATRGGRPARGVSGTRASGSAWTRSATRSTSRSIWDAGSPHPGRSWWRGATATPCRFCGAPLRAVLSPTSACRRSPTPTCAPEQLDAAEPFYPLHAFVCARLLPRAARRVRGGAGPDLQRLRVLLVVLGRWLEHARALRRAM